MRLSHYLQNPLFALFFTPSKVAFRPTYPSMSLKATFEGVKQGIKNKIFQNSGIVSCINV